MSISPARSRAAARSSAPRPAPSRRSASNSAARTRPMCAPTPISTHAIENLVDGAFFNSGQCCCGIERIYVHEAPLRPLRRRLRRSDRATMCSAIRSTRRRRSGRWRTSASPNSCARRRSEALAKGAQGAYRRRRPSPPIPASTRLSRAAGSDRCRSLDERDARGELRPRRRHHEGLATTRRRSA